MTGRIEELEAIRGWAALLVTTHHSLLAFAPGLHGLVDRSSGSLFGTPAFALINGSAAVSVFFVLSGFVLAAAITQGTWMDRLRLVTTRWPRLAAPVLLVNLLTAVLFAAGCMVNQETAGLSGSTWLAWFYGWPPNGAEELRSAAIEGTWGTFLLGSNAYNSSLWTMYYEFFGSFIVFALAIACVVLPRLKWPLVVITFGFAVLSWFGSPHFGSFVAGAALAFLPNSCRVDHRAWLAVPALMYLAGYHEALDGTGLPAGWYAWLGPVASAVGTEPFRITVHTVFAAGLIWLALNSVVGVWLKGKAGRVLGALSFPLYLVHVPVICSVGAWVYLHSGAPAALAMSITVSLMAALPIAVIDRRWRRILAAVFSTRPIAPPTRPVTE